MFDRTIVLFFLGLTITLGETRTSGLVFIQTKVFNQTKGDESVLVSGLNSTADGERDTGRLFRPEISLPTYGLLRRLKKDISLQKIDRLMKEKVGRGINELKAIEEISRELNVAVQRVQISAPTGITVPCLLVVSKTAKPGEAGALLLVEAIAADQLQVFDFQGGKGRGYLHFTDLPIVWNGDALVPVSSLSLPSSNKYFGIFAVVAGIALILGTNFWLRRGLRVAKAPTKCLVCLISTCVVLVGCNRSSTDTQSHEVFQSPIQAENGAIIDLGVLDEGAATTVFSIPLKVTHSRPLRISRVIGNCSCYEVGEGIVETKFKPGDAFNLQGKIRLDGKVGDDVLILQLISEDNEQTLPVCKFGVRFFVPPRIQCNDQFLDLLGPQGGELGGKLNVFLVRRKTDRVLEFDQKRSRLGLLKVQCHEEIGTSFNETNLVKDWLKLEFTLPKESDMNGQLVELKFTGSEQMIAVPVRTVIMPELVAEPSSLFLGILKSKEPIKKEIRIFRSASSDSEKMFRIDDLNDNWVKIIDQDCKEEMISLTLEFFPTQDSGRIEKELRLSSGDGKTVTVPVTWINPQ